MKAFVLAAGLGTRLRPITDEIPKCLVPINGKPLLHYWLERFERDGVTEILINTHHLATKVREFLGTAQTSLVIHHVHEPELLGSAGTVSNNRTFIQPGESFYIVYADNLTSMNLAGMRTYHETANSLFTIALYHTLTPQACGIVELDEFATVQSFIEKPATPRSDLANTGIYLTDSRLFDEPAMSQLKRPLDFGFDVLPGLVGRMKGFVINEPLIDIGCHENLQRAEQLWCTAPNF